MTKITGIVNVKRLSFTVFLKEEIMKLSGKHRLCPNCFNSNKKKHIWSLAFAFLIKNRL